MVTLSKCAERKLLAHDWPGNVRELENLLQRSLILLQGQVLTGAELAFESGTDVPVEAEEGGLTEDLKNHEFQLIVDAMRQHGSKRAAVAEALGISPRTLRYKLARMRENGMEY
jgi:two-component system response regulator FlrC